MHGSGDKRNIGVFRDAFGDPLVIEHVGVPPRLAIVDAEGVPRVEPLEPRVLFEFAFRKRTTAAVEFVARGRLPTVEVVRPAQPPGLGVGRDLGDVGDADERLPHSCL